jgi:carbamoyl-phosphate synthase large subunit
MTACLTIPWSALRGALRQPTPERIFQIKRGLDAGMSVDDLHELTKIDPWFLWQMRSCATPSAVCDAR